MFDHAAGAPGAIHLVLQARKRSRAHTATASATGVRRGRHDGRAPERGDPLYERRVGVRNGQGQCGEE